MATGLRKGDGNVKENILPPLPPSSCNTGPTPSIPCSRCGQCTNKNSNNCPPPLPEPSSPPLYNVPPPVFSTCSLHANSGGSLFRALKRSQVVSAPCELGVDVRRTPAICFRSLFVIGIKPLFGALGLGILGQERTVQFGAC